jgi:hypothetical protein
VSSVWDPFFSDKGALNGTETIITSDVSKAWPIPDGPSTVFFCAIRCVLKKIISGQIIDLYCAANGAAQVLLRSTTVHFSLDGKAAK